MILDAGVLISIDRGDDRGRSLVNGSRRQGTQLYTTHPVLAQVWRSGGRQARLASALASIQVRPLDDGRAVGQLLARSGTADVVDAHLVLLGLRLGQGILTADVEDLSALAAVLGPGAPRVYRWPPE